MTIMTWMAAKLKMLIEVIILLYLYVRVAVNKIDFSVIRLHGGDEDSFIHGL